MMNNQDDGSFMYPIINGPNQELNLQSNPGQATIRQAMPRQATPRHPIHPIIAFCLILVIVLIFAAFIVFYICVMYSPEFCNCS